MRFYDEDFSSPEERDRFIELVVASLTSAIDYYERAAAAISNMSARVDQIEQAVQNEIDRLRERHGADATDATIEQEYAAWLNERGADLARRGPSAAPRRRLAGPLRERGADQVRPPLEVHLPQDGEVGCPDHRTESWIRNRTQRRLGRTTASMQR